MHFQTWKKRRCISHWSLSGVSKFWTCPLGCVYLPPLSAIWRGVCARQREVQDWPPAVPGPAQPCASAATSPGEKAEVGQEEGHPQETSMKRMTHPDKRQHTHKQLSDLWLRHSHFTQRSLLEGRLLQSVFTHRWRSECDTMYIQAFSDRSIHITQQCASANEQIRTVLKPFD